MSLKNVLEMDAVLRRIAERRIEEAMLEGKFDNLPGKGKPLDLEPLPADENARMMWWAIRLLKQNDVLPHEVGLRKHVDALREELATATTEHRVVALVSSINLLVRRLNTMGTNVITTPIAPLSFDEERRRFRERVRTAAHSAAAVSAR